MKKITAFFGVLLALCAVPNIARATVSNTVVQTQTANGDGVTTNFAVTFDFRDNSWLVVTLVDTSVVPASKTIIPQGTSGQAGHWYPHSGVNPCVSIDMGTAPTNTQYLLITRSIPLTQPVVFNPASIFPYSGLSSQVDQITLELQNLNANIGTTSGGGGSGGTTIPTGVGYNLLGWDSAGSTLVNYGGASLVNGDILQFNGTSWVPYLFNGANLISTLNAGSGVLASSVGGSGVANAGNFTWGSNALTLTTTGTTSLTLPTSGTVITGTTSSSNVAGDIVIRDVSGNFAAGTVTANLTGNVTGNLTGNVTGNTSGTSSNVTGTVAIGNGGTGQTTRQAAMNILANQGAAAAGTFLRFDGTNATLQPIGIGDVPQGFSRAKLAQGTANSVIMNDASGNLFDLATSSNSGYVLTSNGTAPTWAAAGTGIPGIYPYGADSGLANAYVVASPNPPVLGYSAGIGLSFLVLHSNTGASTINISSLGLKNIVHADGSALVGGDLVAGKVALIEYDGTNFQLVNPAPNPGGGVLAVTTSQTATGLENFIDINCASACTLTLPVISTLTQTYPFYVKNLSADGVVITVAPGAANTIDGAASATFNFNQQSIIVVPRSTNWEIQ